MIILYLTTIRLISLPEFAETCFTLSVNAPFGYLYISSGRKKNSVKLPEVAENRPITKKIGQKKVQTLYLGCTWKSKVCLCGVHGKKVSNNPVREYLKSVETLSLQVISIYLTVVVQDDRHNTVKQASKLWRMWMLMQ